MTDNTEIDYTEIVGPTVEVSAKVVALLNARLTARAAKDFATADSIRATLDAAGVIVIDSLDASAWKVGPNFDPTKLDPVA